MAPYMLGFSRAECPACAASSMDDEIEFFDAEDSFHDDEPPAATQGTNQLSELCEPGTPAVQPLDSVAQPVAPSPRSEVAEPYPLHRCATPVRHCIREGALPDPFLAV